MALTLDNILTQSEDVVARVVEDEIILVSLLASIGDMDTELYTLNETGMAIWSRLDGERSLRTIAKEMEEEFSVTLDVIEMDVLRLAEELAKRKIVVVQ
jgi:hypothetical protein